MKQQNYDDFYKYIMDTFKRSMPQFDPFPGSPAEVMIRNLAYETYTQQLLILETINSDRESTQENLTTDMVYDIMSE